MNTAQAAIATCQRREPGFLDMTQFLVNRPSDKRVPRRTSRSAHDSIALTGLHPANPGQTELPDSHPLCQANLCTNGIASRHLSMISDPG